LARDPLLGATGEGASVWTRLGKRLLDAGYADAVVLVPIAVGGSSIRQWDKDGIFHLLLQQAIMATQQAGLKISSVLYHQDESDATFRIDNKVIKSGLNAMQYRKHLISLIHSLRQMDIQAPIFIPLASRCGPNLPDPEITSAQQSVFSPQKGIFMGPNTDQLTGHLRYDGCHFNSSGLDRFSQLWLKQIAVNQQSRSDLD
jgi:hypothetical protein